MEGTGIRNTSKHLQGYSELQAIGVTDQSSKASIFGKSKNLVLHTIFIHSLSAGFCSKVDLFCAKLQKASFFRTGVLAFCFPQNNKFLTRNCSALPTNQQ